MRDTNQPAEASTRPEPSIGGASSRPMTTRRLLTGLAGAIALAAGLATAQDDPPLVLEADVVQARQLQPAQPVPARDAAAEAVEGLAAVDEDADDFLDELDLNPGFMFTPIPDSADGEGPSAEDVQRMLNEFYKSIDNELWDQAFKNLLMLSKATQYAMVLVGEEGTYVPVRRSIQLKLNAMPTDGRRAFAAFFDAHARALLGRCQGHPQPGSDAQLDLADEIYEMYLMSSSGGEAANLLGDLLFERGKFAQAADVWGSVITARVDAPVSELTLRVKQALALGRAGQANTAHEIAEGIRLRYPDSNVTLGGREQNAIALLDAVLPEAGAIQQVDAQDLVPTGLPAADAPPAWRMTFVDDTAQRRMTSPDQNRGYYGVSQDLLYLVPPAVVDDRAVYAHWMGVVFAVDLESGKLLWRSGSFSAAARTVTTRMNGVAGNSRAYQIAESGSLVFTIDTPEGRAAPDRFILSAYDKATGQVAWSSHTNPQWVDHSFCGQIVTKGDMLYTISHAKDTRDLLLHCVLAATGEFQWSVPLGEADVKANQWLEFVTMPQPAMKLHGDDLYVLTNNAALISVDTARGELAWGQRLSLPEGFTDNNNNWGNQSSVTTNSQSAGGLYIFGNTLYVKESQSRMLYGIDLTTNEILWNKATHQHSEIVGADGEHVFLMDQRLRAYRTDQRHQLHWNNNQLRNPIFANGILTDKHFFMLTDRQLQMLDLDSGDPASNDAGDTIGVFESDYLRGNGGRLLLGGDLMICITQRDITAYRVSTAETTPQTND